MNTLTFTTTTDAAAAAARVLLGRVDRVELADAVFEAHVAIAGWRFRLAAEIGFATQDVHTRVTVDVEHLDEILTVLEGDPDAVRGLVGRFLRDAREALDPLLPSLAGQRAARTA